MTSNNKVEMLDLQATLTADLHLLPLLDTSVHPSKETCPSKLEDIFECQFLDAICTILAGDVTETPARPFAAALDKHHPLTVVLARSGGASDADRALAGELFSAARTADNILPFVIERAPGCLTRLFRKLGAIDVHAVARALSAYVPAADASAEITGAQSAADWRQLAATYKTEQPAMLYAQIFAHVQNAMYIRMDDANSRATGARVKLIFLLAEILARSAFFARPVDAGADEPWARAVRKARRRVERVHEFHRALWAVPLARRRCFAAGAEIPHRWADAGVCGDLRRREVVLPAPLDGVDPQMWPARVQPVVHAEVQIVRWFMAHRALEELFEWPCTRRAVGAEKYQWDGADAECDWVYKGGDWEGTAGVRLLGSSKRTCVCCEVWIAGNARGWRTSRGWGNAFQDWAMPRPAGRKGRDVRRKEIEDAPAFASVVADRVDEALRSIREEESARMKWHDTREWDVDSVMGWASPSGMVVSAQA